VPHPRNDSGGFYLEHALHDALQLHVAAALQWRCDANTTTTPAKLTRFAQPLFRLVCDVLRDLPDTDPTRGIIALKASHGFQPILRVVESATEMTTVTAADAYLRALKQVEENALTEKDSTFITAFGDTKLPETAAALMGLDDDARKKVIDLLKTRGPILVLLNRDAAMGPDVMVLSYGYGAIVASCKADNAGEDKHTQALCKLGVATAPFAYGDAFPVVRYALVHGAAVVDKADDKAKDKANDKVEHKAKDKAEDKAEEKAADKAEQKAKDKAVDKVSTASTREKIQESLDKALASAQNIGKNNFGTITDLASFAKDANVPSKEYLLYAVRREARRQTAERSADVKLSEELLTFHQKGLEAFVKRLQEKSAERFKDIEYIVAAHGSTSLSPMPLPAGVAPAGMRKFYLKR